MARLSRFKLRESDRSGFKYFERELVKDEGLLVSGGEVDQPPPSKRSTGGSDISPGELRPNDTSLTTPAGLDKVTRYITAAGGIAYSDTEPWLYVVGSNAEINITADPQISRATEGTLFTLECVGSAILLETGSGLSLRAPYRMDSGAILTVVYTTANNVWLEASRSHRERPLGIM